MFVFAKYTLRIYSLTSCPNHTAIHCEEKNEAVRTVTQHIAKSFRRQSCHSHLHIIVGQNKLHLPSIRKDLKLTKYLRPQIGSYICTEY